MEEIEVKAVYTMGERK